MNLTEIEVENLELKSTSWGKVIKVNLIGVEVGEIVEQLSAEQIIEYKPTAELLEQIGKEECMEYFGLIEE